MDRRQKMPNRETMISYVTEQFTYRAVLERREAWRFRKNLKLGTVHSSGLRLDHCGCQHFKFLTVIRGPASFKCNSEKELSFKHFKTNHTIPETEQQDQTNKRTSVAPVFSVDVAITFHASCIAYVINQQDGFLSFK